MNILNFIKSGFNTNCGYIVMPTTYSYLGVPQLGYVLAKNYTIFWIPGYDRIGVFLDMESLNQYLELHSIKL